MNQQPKDLTRVSKKLAYILRHDPSAVDENGWIDLKEAASKLSDGYRNRITTADIEDIVESDSKGRYEIVKGRIRAVQGHSHTVDLGLTPVEPPPTIYHGTVHSAVRGIFQDGIQARSRTHVHMSGDLDTAIEVGRRRGEAVILRIDAARAHADGVAFYLSKNGVWLAEHIPARYIGGAGERAVIQSLDEAAKDDVSNGESQEA